ncbi:MAG: hypothetical protein B7X11_05280, partial [Acidobacteria bacterium 37-65-4]
MADRRLKVALLGATGMVGQRFVQLLQGHPWFELSALVASDRSAGKPYGEAVRWLLPGGVPEGAAGMRVRPLDPGGIEAAFAFSALDAATASEAELAFRAAGFAVISNASALRMDPEVPLVIPEVNADHLALLASQRARYGGAVAANPNCSTIGLCLSLEPLRRAFGLRRVLVTTLQALSGAGHPGVASLEALDNVLPEIAGEEAKLRAEPAKIFGRIEGGVHCLMVGRTLPLLGLEIDADKALHLFRQVDARGIQFRLDGVHLVRIGFLAHLGAFVVLLESLLDLLTVVHEIQNERIFLERVHAIQARERLHRLDAGKALVHIHGVQQRLIVTCLVLLGDQQHLVFGRVELFG